MSNRKLLGDHARVPFLSFSSLVLDTGHSRREVLDFLNHIDPRIPAPLQRQETTLRASLDRVVIVARSLSVQQMAGTGASGEVRKMRM